MDKTPKQEFGQLLYTLRMAQGISQNRLARMSGVDFTYVSKLENGHRLPTKEVAEKLVKGLGFQEKDLRSDMLLEASGHLPEDVPAHFECMELYLLNDLYAKSDNNTQIDLRITLRLIAEGLENRLKGSKK